MALVALNPSVPNVAKHIVTIIVVPENPFESFVMHLVPNQFIQNRGFSSKKGKAEKRDDGKIKQFADFNLDYVDDLVFLQKVSSIVEQFPVADCDSFYKRSLSPFLEYHTPVYNKVFNVKVTCKGKTVYPLYSRINFQLMAVRSEKKLLVVKSEEEFKELEDHFVRKELVEKKKIKYFEMKFNSDSVLYGFKELVESVGILSCVDGEVDSYNLMRALNMFCGFGFSFAMKDWSTSWAYLFKHKKRRGKGTTDRMKAVRDNWLKISQYIHSGGRKGCNIRFVRLDLQKVKNILYVLHFKEGTKEEKLQMRDGLPEPPKEVKWFNPAPDRIVPSNARRFSSASFLPKNPRGPVLFLPGSGIGPALCGSRTGPLCGRPNALLSYAPSLLKLFRRL